MASCVFGCIVVVVTFVSVNCVVVCHKRSIKISKNQYKIKKTWGNTIMVWPSSGCSPFVVLYITWWVVDVVGFIKRPTNVATACWSLLLSSFLFYKMIRHQISKKKTS